ncbi:hypothetical protein [Paraburkholderia tropica]|uniref:hypothetical protein n=1 Tax=Paraburkholderia tropica TaxID=92647 RepID=UPI002ABE434C|nr:hypothetical protein [Paraburkholderia tropica]
MNVMQRERQEGAEAANAEDASVWRWFSALLDERRIKWRCSFGQWVITVDRTQLAVGCSFDSAIRLAKSAEETRGAKLSSDFPKIRKVERTRQVEIR